VDYLALACHHRCISISPPPLSIIIASGVIFAAIGAVAWVRARRKRERLAGVTLLLGIPGVYIADFASWDEPRWLYAPAGVMMAGAVVVQVLAWRRQSRRLKVAPTAQS
jgi:uncharacterized membrane protein